MTPLAWNLVLAAMLLLFATDIGDELLVEEVLPVAAAPVPSPTSEAHLAVKMPRPARQPRPALPTSEGPLVDPRAFARSYRRQAEDGLMTCLEAWQKPPYSLAVTASLDASGKLSTPKPLDPATVLPDCVETATAGMSFKPLVTKLGGHAVTMQWRIDW